MFSPKIEHKLQVYKNITVYAAVVGGQCPFRQIKTSAVELERGFYHSCITCLILFNLHSYKIFDKIVLQGTDN